MLMINKNIQSKIDKKKQNSKLVEVYGLSLSLLILCYSVESF